MAPRTLSGRTNQPQAHLRVVDLFAGAGGLSEGFRQAGFEITAGTDHDPDAAATYRANFPGARTLCGDIRDPALREEFDSIASGVDIVVGGPPCQAFSQVRNHSRLIDDPRNSLYREFVSAVAAARPRAFLMENVPGMAQMGVLDQVVSDLSLDGEYTVRPQLVDAADFGVPQSRRRLLFLGVRHDLDAAPPSITGTGLAAALQLTRFAGATAALDVSASSRYAVTARPDESGQAVALSLADPEDLAATTALQAIGDLAALESGRRDDILPTASLPATASAYQRLMRAGLGAELANVSVPRMREDTALRLAGIPAGGNHRDLPEHLTARYLTDSRWGPSTGSGRLGRAHYSAYRRLHPDLFAWTPTTNGGSVYHYGPARCLSVRAFARLQSFPDRFVFTTDQRRGPLQGRISGGGAHSRYRQVGNAVPVLLAAAAAAALRQALEPAAQPTLAWDAILNR